MFVNVFIVPVWFRFRVLFLVVAGLFFLAKGVSKAVPLFVVQIYMCIYIVGIWPDVPQI